MNAPRAPVRPPSRLPPPSRSLRLGIGKPEAALIFVTMLWGGTFLAVQHAMTVSGALFFVGLRFGAAAILLALLSWRSLGGMTLLEIKAGCVIGVVMMLGYTLQTIGLETVLSSKSAFLTALYVPIVPLLQWAVLRRPPSLAAWAGVTLAFAGLVLLTGPEGASVEFSRGEMLTVLSAIAFAAEIILIGLYAGRVDARRVTILQLAVTSILAFAAMVPAGEAVPAFSWTLVLLALGLAVASAVIQLAMNWAQKFVSPTRATIIYAGEPVWAGLFGRLAGEVLPGRALIGAALIVAAVLVSELKLGTSKPAASKRPQDGQD